MIKIKDLSEAIVGDFISFNQKLSIIRAISVVDDTVIILLDDGTEINVDTATRVEIFRIRDRI
jgi:hypothetical protein